MGLRSPMGICPMSIIYDNGQMSEICRWIMKVHSEVGRYRAGRGKRRRWAEESGGAGQGEAAALGRGKRRRWAGGSGTAGREKRFPRFKAAYKGHSHPPSFFYPAVLRVNMPPCAWPMTQRVRGGRNAFFSPARQGWRSQWCLHPPAALCLWCRRPARRPLRGR